MNTSSKGVGDGDTRKRRVKTTENKLSPGDAPASDRVPEVRGDGQPTVEPSVRGMGLSGLSTATSRVDLKALSKSIANLAETESVEFTYRSYSDLSLDQKLCVLNALQKIKQKLPNLNSFDEPTQQIISHEYVAWVESQMKQVMGSMSGAQTEQPFSDEEIKVLKNVVRSVQQRVSSAQPTTTKQPAPSVPKPKAEPLKPGVDLTEYHKAQMTILKQLDEMDRDGPSF